MEKVVERIREEVCLDPDTEHGCSMESAKVLVYTCHMPFIEDQIQLLVDGRFFEVYLKELESSPNFISNQKIYTSPGMKIPVDSMSRVAETSSGRRKGRTEVHDDDVAGKLSCVNEIGVWNDQGRKKQRAAR